MRTIRADWCNFKARGLATSRIEDYALIGDCHTAALVARDGSIDWLCFPRFDSGACFAALLGTANHGRWQIAPDTEVTAVHRHYRHGTPILETEFHTGAGAAKLVDFMPPRAEAPRVIRIAEGVRGEVPMRMELAIRFDYGVVVPWVRRIEDGIRATAGPDTLYLRTAVELSGEDLRTLASFTLHEGQQVAFELAWTPTYGGSIPDFNPEASLKETERWWHDWYGQCSYKGQWSEAVHRSLITLKALSYAPTGGVVAAPTTSLPEQLGGMRNWDYRYCWLRDATFTLYALMVGGYRDEARLWREWLVNAVAGTPAQMQIMYGLAGERSIAESTGVV